MLLLRTLLLRILLVRTLPVRTLLMQTLLIRTLLLRILLLRTLRMRTSLPRSRLIGIQSGIVRTQIEWLTQSGRLVQRAGRTSLPDVGIKIDFLARHAMHCHRHSLSLMCCKPGA